MSALTLAKPRELFFRHQDLAEQGIKICNSKEVLITGQVLGEFHEAVDDDAVKARALALTALRETAEETGLILGVPGAMPAEAPGGWSLVADLPESSASGALAYGLVGSVATLVVVGIHMLNQKLDSATAVAHPLILGLNHKTP